MNKTILSLVLLAFVLVSCKSDKKTTKSESVAPEKVAQAKGLNTSEKWSHTLDTTSSQMLWKGFKPLESHDGRIDFKSGVALFEDNQLKKGEFVIDMTSILVLDIPADDKYNAKLVKHLNDSDFFDTGVHPTATFKITDVTTSEGKTTLTGNLKIKEITHSIKIPVEIAQTGETLRLTSNGVLIDRTLFDIKYKSKKFFDNLKNKFIKDKFEIKFKITLKKS